MDNNQFELYDYAHKRVKQKKRLYFHFILFLVGGLFMIIINKFLNVGTPYNWSLWGITVWSFVFILHLIKVFITDRFMNKNWEREHLEKLVAMQKRKLEKLEKKNEENFSDNSYNTSK